MHPSDGTLQLVGSEDASTVGRELIMMDVALHVSSNGTLFMLAPLS